MPRTPSSAGPATWQKTLARLPRRRDLVIVGGTRLVGLYIRENRQTIQPQIAIWLEAKSEYIRAVQVLTSVEDVLPQALESLVTALTHPAPVPDAAGVPRPPQPGLPAKIVVNDAALAAAARDLFAPLNVPVEYAEDIPAFDEAFRMMSATLGAQDEGPPEPFAWAIDEALLPPLYTAAAGYWRRAPWEYLGSDLPISIELGRHGPQAGVPTLYAVVLGNAGEVFGLAFYYSLEGFQRTLQQGLADPDLGAATPGGETDEAIDEMIALLRQSGAPVDDVPPDELRRMVAGMLATQGPAPGGADAPMNEEAFLAAIEDSLVVYFDTEEDSDPFYLEWLADRRLKVAGRDAVPAFHRMVEHSGPIRPTPQEVVALTVALEALNNFFTARRAAILRRYPPDMIVLPRAGTDRIEHVAPVPDPQAKGRRLAVRVRLPAEGFVP